MGPARRCSGRRSRWTLLCGSAAENSVVVRDELLAEYVAVRATLAGEPFGRRRDVARLVPAARRAGWRQVRTIRFDEHAVIWDEPPDDGGRLLPFPEREPGKTDREAERKARLGIIDRA